MAGKFDRHVFICRAAVLSWRLLAFDSSSDCQYGQSEQGRFE
jgi:hypothetical protein